MLTTVDLHTEGEPIRVVTGGIPNIPGETMHKKRDFFRQNIDHLRTALVNEPRGHTDMFDALNRESYRWLLDQLGWFHIN